MAPKEKVSMRVRLHVHATHVVRTETHLHVNTPADVKQLYCYRLLLLVQLASEAGTVQVLVRCFCCSVFSQAKCLLGCSVPVAILMILTEVAVDQLLHKLVDELLLTKEEQIVDIAFDVGVATWCCTRWALTQDVESLVVEVLVPSGLAMPWDWTAVRILFCWNAIQYCQHRCRTQLVGTWRVLCCCDCM